MDPLGTVSVIEWFHIYAAILASHGKVLFDSDLIWSFYGSVNTTKVMLSWSVNLLSLFLGISLIL